MLTFIIRRLLISIPTLLFISLIIFLLLNLAPNDPMAQVPLTVPPEVKEKMGDQSLDLREVMYDGEKVGTFDATDLPELREVSNDRMWQHSCTVEMAVVWIGKDETCNYCGAWEEDGQ